MTATPSPDELADWLNSLAKNLDADRYDECWEVKETATGKELRAAAALIRELVSEKAKQREALQYVDDCFNAAIIEGWIDAKEEGDIERIRDLWQRRISYAWRNTINVLQDGKGE